MHWAAKKGNFEMAKLLLKYGADPDQPDYFQRGTIYWACLNKDKNMIKVGVFLRLGLICL